MVRALIVDDNAEARRTLTDDLALYCPEVELIALADSVKTGVESVKLHKPELIFLDIELGDGLGFEVLTQIGNYKGRVIFTTASEGYAIKAFKFSAVDYLLKPIDPDELVQAVKKAKPGKAGDTQMKESIKLLMENLKGLNPATKRIALSSADRIHLVQVNDIIRCESQRNYTLFYLADKRQILVTRTLKEYEEMLGEYGFIRVHHSHLININYLQEFIKADSDALMADGSHIPVSVRKKDDLLKELGLG